MKILLLIFKVFYNNTRVTTIDKHSLQSLTCVAFYLLNIIVSSLIITVGSLGILALQLSTPLPPLEYWSYKLWAWHRGTEEGFGGICCA
jgi:hypothetical protein